MMNLFVDSTKSSKSALSERESRTVDDVMIPGKEWQRTSDTSFPSSSLFLSNGSEKAGTRTRKMAEGKRTILAENEDWRWPWRESAESGGDWQETTAWLAGVTEVCVRHMSVPRALSEVSMHAHCLPSVSAIQLVDNDITTLHQVGLTIASASCKWSSASLCLALLLL